MRYREFGTTGISVSELGMGCSRLGGVLRPSRSRGEELALLGAVADAGINFFDTADIYAQGQSEVLVGQALRHRRSEVVIATKGGYVLPVQRRLVARVKPVAGPIIQRLGIKRPRIGGGGHAPMAQDFSPAYLADAVDASLRRLGTDYIDVYQLHSPSRSVVELGDYITVLEKLKSSGKVLHYGLAADAAADVVSFDKHQGIASLQVPFSLLCQEASVELFPKTSSLAVGVISRSCYAAGLFKEQLTREELLALTPDWERILQLREKATELGRPLLETALQFNLAAAPIAVTIVGMHTRTHLQENLRYYSAPSLAPAELAALTYPRPELL